MYAKATEVLNAPSGGDAGRIRKMMSARPTLNANQRRSKVRSAPQDPSAFSPEGTMVGRGGRVQAAGPAMQRRLAARQAPPAGVESTMGDGPPPGSVTPEMIATMHAAANPVPQIGGGAPSDMDLQAAQAGGAAPGMPPGIDPTMFATPSGPGGPFGQGLPPQIMRRLQALKGGGMQPGATPPTGGPMPPRRSFQDFWQGGMAPRGM